MLQSGPTGGRGRSRPNSFAADCLPKYNTSARAGFAAKENGCDARTGGV